MKQYLEVTYRDIAKMMARAMPVEGQEYGLKVNELLETIKRLPQASKVALKVAYVFSRKVPREEREDLFQDIALAVLKAKTPDERLAYSIARCDWRDWWKKYSIRQHYSLDSVVEDNEGNPVTMAELIVGEAEFERKMDGKLDAERIFNRLPDDIKPIINKRLIGKALNSSERNKLNRYVHKFGAQLLLA
jgi:DNA-directed RNA polymerase specialized sigma24 family protein